MEEENGKLKWVIFLRHVQFLGVFPNSVYPPQSLSHRTLRSAFNTRATHASGTRIQKADCKPTRWLSYKESGTQSLMRTVGSRAQSRTVTRFSMQKSDMSGDLQANF